MNIEFPSSKEIKARIANKQVKLDGETITFDQYKNLDLNSAVHLGDYLYKHATPQIINLYKILGIDSDDIATTNIPALKQIFKNKQILRLSKKDLFVLNK